MQPGATIIINLLYILIILPAVCPAQLDTTACYRVKYITNAFSNPSTNSVPIFILQRGDSVHVIGFDSGWFKVKNKEGNIGYLDPEDLEFPKELDELRKMNYTDSINVKTLKNENRILDKLNKAEQRRVDLQKKYGEEIGQKIYLNKIWVGMTSGMVIDSRGTPDDIKKFVHSWGTHEHWIYINKYSTDYYLYFENGRLSSWQQF